MTMSRFNASLCRAAVSLRSYHASPRMRLPYKDSQDRESLKPRSNEGTRSGRDDDAADASQAAFGRDTTSPEAARDKATKQDDGDPLGTSGANQELSKPQGDENGRSPSAGKEVRKGGRSGGGNATKKGQASKMR